MPLIIDDERARSHFPKIDRLKELLDQFDEEGWDRDKLRLALVAQKEARIFESQHNYDLWIALVNRIIKKGLVIESSPSFLDLETYGLGDLDLIIRTMAVDFPELKTYFEKYKLVLFQDTFFPTENNVLPYRSYFMLVGQNSVPTTIHVGWVISGIGTDKEVRHPRVIISTNITLGILLDDFTDPKARSAAHGFYDGRINESEPQFMNRIKPLIAKFLVETSGLGEDDLGEILDELLRRNSLEKENLDYRSWRKTITEPKKLNTSTQ